jgi:hypothetical protein
MMRNSLLYIVMAMLFLACTSDEEKAQKALVQKANLAGDKITTVAFQALSGHLKAAMATGGVENAINYCNVQALPLTDSLSKNFDVQIKRTSRQLRNPANTPDSLESYMLGLYQDISKMKKPMVGKAILARDQNIRYFAPIIVKTQCLACHGTVGEQVDDSTYNLLQARYPADAATGYKLRGIWSVNFGSVEHTKEVIASLNSQIPEIKD